MFGCPHSVVLLVKGVGTGLLIGKAGSSSAGNFELKGLCEHGGTVPAVFHSLPSASSLKEKRKVEIWA